jgi:hypothetical protein
MRPWLLEVYSGLWPWARDKVYLVARHVLWRFDVALIFPS